ncbi:protein C18orf25 homolog isoform X2 [Xyrauchen texanus]|uniref:protein C18orf25 homolog isoform X2 n=1 Tax=Xyrauchen texanus TaxID=154827 RepID=UPI0022418F6A|nr:protein C18orf25 homolog isoform X2 [Xyrauchen texanus]
MTDAQKANELPECPLEDGATAEEQEMPLRQETMPTGSPVGDEPISSQNPDKQPTPGLLSMPCLLKELHRDSDSGQPAETERPPITTQPYPQEDSDSSVCLRSPSSSGHLGDSDTLSSAEEVTAPTQNAGRKSRRSHSESDTSSVAMAAKKNRCQEKQVNGRVRVRGPRSQRQKLRMRQLRQKREAAARRKPDVLQDSSTSDSDITAHSSSSSPLTASSDNEGETINSHAPVGPAVVGHYDISDTHSELEHQSHSLSGAVKVEPSQVSLASTDSEVEIVGVQENTSVISRFPRGGVIQSLSSWKQRAPPTWTSVSAQSGWVPPPEVVDLTLDEDRHRFLL